MTTPVLGEFLAAADSQIDLAVSCPVPHDDPGKAAAITQLDRLAGTLARYAASVTIISEPDPQDTGLRTGISCWAALIWSPPTATIVLSALAGHRAKAAARRRDRRPDRLSPRHRAPRACPLPGYPAS